MGLSKCSIIVMVIALAALAASAVKVTAFTISVSKPLSEVVVLSAEEANGMIRENSEVIFACQTLAHPMKNTTYKWLLNDDFIPRQSRPLCLMKIMRKHHGSLIRCQAKNYRGAFEGTLKLNVSYAPKFRTFNYTVEAEIGNKLSLICDADGNPPPAYTWFHRKSNRVVGTSRMLTVIVDKNSDGTYFCEARVPGFPESFLKIKIFIKNQMEETGTDLALLTGISIMIGVFFSAFVILTVISCYKARHLLQ